MMAHNLKHFLKGCGTCPIAESQKIFGERMNEKLEVYVIEIGR